MSFTETGPSKPVTEGIRVDKVSPRAKFGKTVRIIVILILAVGGLIPIVIMGVTSLKSRADIVSVPPKITFEPTLEGFVFLLTERSNLSGKRLEEAKANAEDLGLFDQIALKNGQTVTGPSDFTRRLWNSFVIAVGSTM